MNIKKRFDSEHDVVVLLVDEQSYDLQGALHIIEVAVEFATEMETLEILVDISAVDKIDLSFIEEYSLARDFFKITPITVKHRIAYLFSPALLGEKRWEFFERVNANYGVLVFKPCTTLEAALGWLKLANAYRNTYISPESRP
ncbi:MAG: hypothetical protein QGM50_06975 [Anaerolineae bacterium]|nr:hypothetical protein [Anaerolineae bacterium]